MLTKRRYPFIIIAILLLGALLAACDASATPQAPTVTLAPSTAPQQTPDVASSVDSGQTPKMIEFYTKW